MTSTNEQKITWLTANPYKTKEDIPRYSGYSKDHRMEQCVFRMLQAVEDLDAWAEFAQMGTCSFYQGLSRYPKVNAATNHPLVEVDGHSGNTMVYTVKLTYIIIAKGVDAYAEISEKNQAHFDEPEPELKTKPEPSEEEKKDAVEAIEKIREVIEGIGGLSVVGVVNPPVSPTSSHGSMPDLIASDSDSDSDGETVH